MEKEAFEPTGLIPRSIIRTVDRFAQQLLPGKEKIALQEYRVSRYQILVSIKSLLTLVLIPLFLNSTIKALVFTPIIEHFWNSHQAEIFLNQYQEKRAFSEMHDFSEKMFFESLLIEPGQPSIVFLPDEEQSETLYNNRDGTPISWPCEKKQTLWVSDNLDSNCAYEQLSPRFVGYESTNPSEPYKSLFPLTERAIPKEVYEQKTLDFLGKENISLAYLMAEPLASTSNYKSSYKEKLCTSTAGNFATKGEKLCPKGQVLQSEALQLPLSNAKKIDLDCKTYNNCSTSLSTFVNFDNYKYQKAFQIKSLELAKSYNKQSILAITNLLGDFLTFFIVSLLFRIMRPELIILKSFLTESVYSLSDTTKSFLLILGMDLLVGFHSPRGWELALEGFLRHIGLPENENFILLFVALFPVFLDTVFKYWIFRYLNKISPSTVVTYHSMIE